MRECAPHCVVPAHARTRNHRSQLEQKALATPPKHKAAAYGSRLRADDIECKALRDRPLTYSAANTALAISAVPLRPPNSIGLMPSA
jgi:hypothetical protein